MMLESSQYRIVPTPDHFTRKHRTASTEYAREAVLKAIEEYLALVTEVLLCLNLQAPSETCPEPAEL